MFFLLFCYSSLNRGVALPRCGYFSIIHFFRLFFFVLDIDIAVEVLLFQAMYMKLS